MKDTLAKRIWIFTVEDFDERVTYVDADGRDLSEEDAIKAPFVCALADVRTEAERRAALWENRENRIAAEVVSHSLGKAIAPQ